MKVTVKEVVKDIYSNAQVFKTKHIFKQGKNKLEVVFVDNTEYEQSLKDQKKASLYLFDEKGTEHLLITTRVVYEKTFKDLYKPNIILANLDYFVKKKISLKIGKISTIVIAIMLLIINIIFIFEYGFRQIIYIPIISVVLAVVFFLVNGKLLQRNYRRIQNELQKKLLEEYPNVNKRIEQEKNYYK